MKTTLLVEIALLCATCIAPVSATSIAPAWTGDTWGSISRPTIKATADEMIDSIWMPRNTFRNYQYPGSTYTYYYGVVYTGIAYSQNNPQENWAEFSLYVNTTSGGNQGYGNDCSGFVSICWKLPQRYTTARFEDEIGTYWDSLGSIGSAPTVPLLVGDALNSKLDGHIVMFLSYVTSGITTMEQTPNKAVRGRTWSYSALQNYRPIRRKLIEDGQKCDLTIVEPVVFSPASVAPGGTIRVDWTEKNKGTVASSPAHNTKIFLSTTAWGTTYPVAYYGPMYTLGVGATQPYSDPNILVPALIPSGDYYVTAYIDCDLQLSEADENNNIGSSSPNRVTITQPETVSVPTSIAGPSEGLVAQSLSFTGSGASSSLGHGLEYQFDWGDSTVSSWGSATQSKEYSSSGTYGLKARARCATHTDKVSAWSGTLRTVTITEMETVSAPTSIAGPSEGLVAQSLSFTGSGASSNLGHGLEYQFDWGDGATSSWGSATQSKEYSSSGAHGLKARARCATHTDKVSAWSGTLRTVTITEMETVSAPTSIAGPSEGLVAQSLSFTGSGASSNLGHGLEYQFDWGDGATSPWGSATQSKEYSSSGAHGLKARARCATHTDKVSAWSGTLRTVTITEPVPAFSATRSFSPAFYTSPGTVDVSIEISYGGSDVPSAFVIVESIPAGWSFNSVVSCWAPPVICPEPGDESVALGWSQIAHFPAVLTYRLNVPAADSGRKTFLGMGGATTMAGEVSFTIGGDQTIGPGISEISIDPDSGDFVLSWEGQAGKAYQVEASDDLEVWYEASDLLVPLADGPVSWRDFDSAVFRQRFYRLLLLTN